MAAPLALAYLVFDVTQPPAWDRFLVGMLGLPAPLSNVDGSRGWQLDDAAQRLIVRPGDADDVAALGFDCGDDATLEALLERLLRAGQPVRAADYTLLSARRVRRLHLLRDPDGNGVELCTGLARAQRPFQSLAFPQGFCTGDLGLGHAVLVSRDIDRMENFYVDLLGFSVTERLNTRIGPMQVRGTFLHCNRRHHSLALFDMPLDKHLHHFMLQAPSVSDVGRAYERARRQKVPPSLGLGQHPAPDGTFSFYGATPSGFDFEIGAGTHAIEPAGWQVQETAMASTWGHKPALRLQLKMAAGIVRRRLQRRPSPAAAPATPAQQEAA